MDPIAGKVNIPRNTKYSSSHRSLSELWRHIGYLRRRQQKQAGIRIPLIADVFNRHAVLRDLRRTTQGWHKSVPMTTALQAGDVQSHPFLGGDRRRIAKRR